MESTALHEVCRISRPHPPQGCHYVCRHTLLATVLASLALVVALSARAPAAPAQKPPTTRGTLHSVTPKAEFTRAQAQAVLSGELSTGFRAQQRIGRTAPRTTRIKGASARDGAAAFEIRYWSVDPKGAPVLLSGLLVVPRHAAGHLPLLCYLHGTRSERSDVPSMRPDSAEAALSAALFASNGWAVALPDYYGLGICKSGFQTYLVDRLSIPACLDMIRASQAALTRLGLRPAQRLFLTGFSQGGHLAMALARHLQEHPEPALRLAAAAPMAGFYRLTAADFLSFITSTKSDRAALGWGPILTLWIYSYHKYYGAPLRLSDMFREKWLEKLPRLVSGDVSLEKMAVILFEGTKPPRQPSHFLDPGDVELAARDPRHPFAQALADNDQSQWTPQFPMCLVWSTTDELLPSADSRSTYEGMVARGAPMQAFTTTGGHLESFARQNLAAFHFLDAQRRR